MTETDKREIKELISIFKKDSRVIEIEDFGAGSRKMGKRRMVSAIFRNSSSHGKYGRLLYQIAKNYAPNNILEFGTSLGVGTTYLSLGSPDSKITTIEACQETRLRALEHLADNKKVDSVLSKFDDYLKSSPKIIFDLVFIDGHHDGNALLDYMERLKSITHDETIFVLDDIRWSQSMFDTWEQIVNDKSYHLTIDHFRVGIVSKRPTQEKEHFTLKL